MDYTPFYEFEVKHVAEEGRFTGYASTFGGSPDLQGDIVLPGAFRETLAGSHGRVPILMGHMMARIVGFGLEAEEDKHGLRVVGEFTTDNDEGRNAYATAKHAAKIGHKLGLSIGYGVREGGYRLEKDTRYLTGLDLYEYSIAAVPANQSARVTTVKSAELTLDDWNRFFRTSGFSKRETERLTYAVKNLASEDAAVNARLEELISTLRSHRR